MQTRDFGNYTLKFDYSREELDAWRRSVDVSLKHVDKKKEIADLGDDTDGANLRSIRKDESFNKAKEDYAVEEFFMENNIPFCENSCGIWIFAWREVLYYYYITGKWRKAGNGKYFDVYLDYGKGAWCGHGRKALEILIKNFTGTTGLNCPYCGCSVEKRVGKYSEFYGCLGFPACKTIFEMAEDGSCSLDIYGKPIVGYVSCSDKVVGRCTECGGDIVEKYGKFGSYFSCTNYPKCVMQFKNKPNGKLKKGKKGNPVAKTKPLKISGDSACTQCQSPLVIRNGRFGQFIGCSGYPKCNAIYKFEDGRLVLKRASVGA